jgi:hypothetical protein
MVAIGMNTRPRIRRQLKLKAALTAFAARLHSKLHRTFTYWCAVEKGRYVAN